MNKTYRIIIPIISIIIITGLLLYGSLVLHGKNYYLISTGIVLTALIAGIISFEKGRPSAGYLTCIVVFIALAAGSRCLFGFIPQVKPVGAIVILSGVFLGRQAGFITGAMSMFLSGFYFMQGAWTPYQMVAMGLVGYLAGAFFHKKKMKPGVKTALIAVYGFLSVLLIYGLIVDINTVFFTLGDEPTVGGVTAVYLAGLPFDLVFALTTAALLALIERPLSKKWFRIEMKYEL
ncbi:MAG: ECF transporter S component [Eubacterium sp.]|nr:ECF transporter S component [Eubacterium sp.]